MPLAALLLSGVVLLLAGGRMVPLLLSIAGMLAGCAAGWTVGESLNLALPSWALAVTGGVVGAVLGALLCRLVMAGLLAALFAWCGLMAAANLGDRVTTPPPAVAAGADAEMEAVWEVVLDDGSPLASLPPELKAQISGAAAQAALTDLDARIRQQLDSIRSQLSSPVVQSRFDQALARWSTLRSDAMAWWDARPSHQRTFLLAASAAAGFLGLMIGLLASRWTAITVTAAAGAATMVVCGGALLENQGVSVHIAPRALLLLWTVLSLIGIGIQRRLSRRPTAPVERPAAA